MEARLGREDGRALLVLMAGSSGAERTALYFVSCRVNVDGRRVKGRGMQYRKKDRAIRYAVMGGWMRMRMREKKTERKTTDVIEVQEDASYVYAGAGGCGMTD